MKMSFRSVCAVAAVGAVIWLAVVAAQSPEPKPALQGQTDAPPPAKPSPPVAVQQVAGGLTGAWAFAFLPDGALLVTQNSGTMRVVKDGVVSAPLAGVPPVKSAAAQGLHDVVLDPDFARNRMLYFT
jgi:glucose/arabinose dehydrogenase